MKVRLKAAQVRISEKEPIPKDEGKPTDADEKKHILPPKDELPPPPKT